MHNLKKQNPIVAALTATIGTAVIAAMAYLLFEPTAMLAATDTDSFTVRQEIGAEISFSTVSGDINMGGSAIGGATGGNRNGSTTVGITTNNAAGYQLDIQFESANGMEHPTETDFIDYYATTSPDYTMNLGANSSGFAYSVSSTAPTNSISSFDNNGSSCGVGSNKSISNCYVMQGTPTSGATIVNTTDTATDELTTIGFRVMVAAGSGLANGFYYATTTLTATTN
mgnify:CR=1 FL=1|tara:strand:+ start:509 stop:1189 length:681 start_codon:yes stop_codon:yes gene_type:complete